MVDDGRQGTFNDNSFDGEAFSVNSNALKNTTCKKEAAHKNPL